MRFIILDIWKDYSYTPNNWRKMDEQDKFDLIAKKQLEIDKSNREAKAMSKVNNNQG